MFASLFTYFAKRPSIDLEVGSNSFVVSLRNAWIVSSMAKCDTTAKPRPRSTLSNSGEHAPKNLSLPPLVYATHMFES